MKTTSRLRNLKQFYDYTSYYTPRYFPKIMTSNDTGLVKKTEELPWHAAYPPPKTTAPVITRRSLLSWMLKGKIAGRDFVLIDLRRTDHTGGTIHGSINMPAQSLYSTIPSLYTLFSTARVETVIWYCGSSRGRGNRAAAWFADYINDQNNTTMESCVLEGGISGWAAAGGEYTSLIDDYEASAWD